MFLYVFEVVPIRVTTESASYPYGHIYLLCFFMGLPIFGLRGLHNLEEVEHG